MSTTQFQMPDNVLLDETTASATYGKFIVQPLEKGYGVTIGNALRRVLLSSLPGYAITAIRIEGVVHEFTSLPGLVEDVTDMILNLKQVRLKATNKKVGKIMVHLKGPGKFMAGDLQKSNPDVEVLNPELHLATLNKDADFEMELRIGRGKGYVTAEENKMPDQPVGMITIDSIFTPIVNVRYNVESTRVGQQTDYEKLTLEVETDGSILPKDAVAYAGKVLRDHIQFFINFDATQETEKEDNERDEEISRIRKILVTPVDELELSVRSHNCLRAADIKTLGDLVRKDEAELLRFRNFGRKSLAELTAIVEANNLTFGMDVDKYLKDSD
ncbi:MAG: DNA-directed RNA polymerase subunit alpha [Bacteroidetes bacterium]|nr:MAG: DNA-directed RNA polymerase subunit alpha [Bacteroidota bacterium]